VAGAVDLRRPPLVISRREAAYSPKHDAAYAVGVNSQAREHEMVPLLSTIFKTLKERGAL
jgi:hypothetical protein